MISGNAAWLEQEIFDASGWDQAPCQSHQGGYQQPEDQDSGQAQNGVFGKLQHNRNIAQP